MWMTAGEHHPQLAILDLRVEKQLVETCFVRRSSGSKLSQNAAADLVAAQGVDDLVLGAAMHPPRRVVRHPADAPRLQGVHERGLHHVFDEVEIPPTEDARQDRDQSAGLMAEEMLHQRSHRLGYTHV